MDELFRKCRKQQREQFRFRQSRLDPVRHLVSLYDLLKQASFRKINVIARMICVHNLSLSFNSFVHIAVVFRSQRLREKIPLLAHHSTSVCKTEVMCSGATWLFPPSRTALQENTADWWKKCFWGISFFSFFGSCIFTLTSLTPVGLYQSTLWLSSVERRCLWSSLMLVFGQKFRMRSAQGSFFSVACSIIRFPSLSAAGKALSVEREWLTALTSCHLLLSDLSYSLLRKSRYRTFISLFVVYLFQHFSLY